ncbi:MAG: prepilin peptidase [Paraclostridium sp.]
MKLFILLIYLLTLIVASYIDIKKRIVYGKINLFIVGLGIINIIINPTTLINSIIGFSFGFTLMVLPALIIEESIGGGDIKLMSASGLLLGADKIVTAICIGVIVAIVVEGIKSIIKKENINNIKFALVPYLSIGCFFSIF